ncbi:MAG: response regulator [Desulfobacteraceae bacterium]|nr:MAG: response regulator [Desulfobacteraceae bacterium]
MRVLLVDDEMELVSTLAERLNLRGIEADWVTSGEAALKQVEVKTYDLALLDIKIPKISGLSLKRKLEEKYPHMKFIFITGHGSEEDFRQGTAEAGEDYYLVKPIDIQVLIEKMNALFQRKGGV